MVTRSWGYTHHGIYVGNGLVVQYGGLSLRLRPSSAKEVALSQFSSGRAISIRSPESTSLGREEILSRARSRLGEDLYHVLRNNCEHFCEWCVSGRHRSYRVDRISSHAFFLRILKPLTG